MQDKRFRNRFAPPNPTYLIARLVSLAFTSGYRILLRQSPTRRHAIRGGRNYTSLAQVGGRLLWFLLIVRGGGEHMSTTAGYALVNRISFGVSNALYSETRRAIGSFFTLLLSLPGIVHRSVGSFGGLEILSQAGTLVKDILLEVHKRSLETPLDSRSSRCTRGGLLLLQRRSTQFTFDGFGVKSRRL